ncbi:RDD family protein [uncultured Acinetobacter sp.]|uniref:RDD family protein n=1 Tax=uncultured Acinetobacter sp. TaxID=165433 RepID=UPI0025897BB2|nr:RDD family protein [uncultured Acinetobacter sp.]
MTYKYEYAGFWLRVGATIIDTLIIMLAVIPAAWIFYHGDVDLIFSTGLSDRQSSPWFDAMINYVFPFIYSILFWIFLKGTPGKRLMRLKVLDEQTGHPLTWGQAILRYIGYFPSTLVLFLGFFWIAFDSKKQGWHDKMAKTVVVREL